MAQSLTEAQRNYSQLEKEALALVTAVERFHKFLWGQKFILQTDHKPLVALLQTENTKALKPTTAARLKRWAIRLLGYDFQIEHIRTHEFGQADALSHLVEKFRHDNSEELQVTCLHTVEKEVQQIRNLSIDDFGKGLRKKLISETEADSSLVAVMQAVRDGWKKVGDSEALQHFKKRCDALKVIKLVESWNVDFDVAIDCLPPLLTLILITTKYLNGVLHTHKLAPLCHIIRRDVERLRDLPQFEVFHFYVMQGRKIVVSLTGIFSILTVGYLALPTALMVHDILTKNASEERYLMYQVDYGFMDPQDHYYFTAVHSYVGSGMIILIVCTMDSMFLTFVQHACAIFAVTGHQLKTVHILGKNVPPTEADKSKTEYEKFVDAQELIHKKLVLCVREHQRAMRYAKILQSAFSVALFIQVTLNIITLSVTGVQTLLKLANGSISDVLRLIIWMLGQYFHLIFIHIPGQRLSNFSEQVYYDSLECTWYIFLHKSRAVYQFFIMNTLLPYRLYALKMTTLNMETLLKFSKAAVSYFTVLSSTL